MRIAVILCVFFLVGCSVNLPNKSQDLSNYKLSNKIIQEQKNSSNNDWAKNNFPASCDWVNFDRVVDGDTIIVGGRERVRMIGIDTPESKKEGTPVQKFSLEATDVLKELLVESNAVCLIYDEVGDQVDTYDRTLAYVFTEKGLDLNAEMLRLGWARAYLSFPMERKVEFASLQELAREQELGRWR